MPRAFWLHFVGTHLNFELVLEDVNERDCRCIDRCGFMRSFFAPSLRSKSNRPCPLCSSTSPITAAVSSHKFRTEFVGDGADVASVEEEGDGADQSAEGSKWRQHGTRSLFRQPHFWLFRRRGKICLVQRYTAHGTKSTRLRTNFCPYDLWLFSDAVTFRDHRRRCLKP